MVDVIQSLGSGLALGEQIARRPQRDLMADLGIQREQQALGLQQTAGRQQQTQFNQQQALQRAQILNQSARALKQISPDQRASAFQRLSPRLQQFGVDPGQFANSSFSDDELDQAIASTQGFISDPAGSMTEFQRQSLAMQKERLNQPTANERDLATYQRLKKESPEDAEAFGRSAGLLPQSEKLTSTGEKALISAQDSYFKGQKDAREYSLLADDFQRDLERLPAGASYSFREFAKNVTGSQDEATELRRRFNAVRLSEALVNLPPGPATDRDVQEAFKGVPKENASPEQVVRFLRGSAKLKAIDNEFNLFKADYITQNNNTKGLLKAWRQKMNDGDIDSVNILDSGEQGVQTTNEDQQALEWARRNPNDPRAQRIIDLQGR